MLNLGIFKSKIFTISFRDYEAMRTFNELLAENKALEQYRKTELKGHFWWWDGYVECAYLICWRDLKEFRLMIERFNKYGNVFYNRELIKKVEEES